MLLSNLWRESILEYRAANRGDAGMFFKAEHVMRMRSLVPKAATYQTCAVMVRDH